MPADDQYPAAPVQISVAPPGGIAPGVNPTRRQVRESATRQGAALAADRPVVAARYLRAVDGGQVQPSATTEGRAHGIRTQLRRDDRCWRCGRTLTDPKSVEAGIGPDCAAKPKTEERT